jgi:hypothetical protein
MYWVYTYKWITLVYFNMIWSICFVSARCTKKFGFVVVRIFVITFRYFKAYQRHTLRHIRVRPSYLSIYPMWLASKISLKQPPGVIYNFLHEMKCQPYKNLYIDKHQNILECDLPFCFWSASRISLQVPDIIFD